MKAPSPNHWAAREFPKLLYVCVCVFNNFHLFIFGCCWVFIAVQAFSSCREQEVTVVAEPGLLIAVASLVAGHTL